MMDLHESIRAARQKANLTGVEVAEALDMAPATYRRYERGEVIPNAEVILALCKVLECSPTALMQTGGDDSPETRPLAEQAYTLDVSLREGETLTIVINASVKPAEPKQQIDDDYEPNRTLDLPGNKQGSNANRA